MWGNWSDMRQFLLEVYASFVSNRDVSAKRTTKGLARQRCVKTLHCGVDPCSPTIFNACGVENNRTVSPDKPHK
jgi:hypothetical protein